MSLLTVDRAYSNLLTHLQRPGSSISLETVISAVPLYLAELALPNPTQLTAFVVSSPLWQPPSIHAVGSLLNAYRSAVRLKGAHLQQVAGSWFARGTKTLIAEWIDAVMKGVSRGDAELRIAILGGLLLGLDDLGHQNIPKGARDKVEGKIIIACAEIIELYSKTDLSWRSEFGMQEDNERNSLFLFSTYCILPSVAADKLVALDLSPLILLCQKGFETAFSSGELLSQLSRSTKSNPGVGLIISPESSLARSLQAINNNILFKDVGLLARLLSRCLRLLADQSPVVAWRTFQEISERMESVTFKVEQDWQESLLASATSEQDIEPATRLLSTEIWKVLKTLLFAHLIVSQSILSSILYLRPLPPHSSHPSPSSIARIILQSLFHLSFVISQFGGVTSSVDGFKELKQTFFMALDVVAADPSPLTGNILVRELLSHVQESNLGLVHPFRLPQTAFVLAVMEQLMSILDEPTVENVIVPFCHLYLDKPEYRETFESAHSVILSIFAVHSQRKERMVVGPVTTKPSLSERLLPFYVTSLLGNSMGNRLNPLQLKLAFSTLVRSATASGDDALGWFCIDALLAHLRAVAPRSPPDVLMPFYLTLVCSISCVSLAILPGVLSEVRKVLQGAESKIRVELGNAILEEITNKVGDREKEAVLFWWRQVAPSIYDLGDNQSVKPM